MELRWVFSGFLILMAVVGSACAYGSSVEDLVGAFSVEKTIKLGSSSSCFSSPDQVDPLDPQGLSSGLSNGPSSGPSSDPSSGPSKVDPMADNQAPSLAGFSLEPEVVSSESSLNLTAHVIDDQSGLGTSEAYFSSPSGKETAEAQFLQENRVSGGSKDGIYSARVTLPKGCEKGAWVLENLTMIDGQGNRRVLQRNDLAAMGLPVEFMVA